MSIKLPKQWRHWCRQAKLQPHGKVYTQADHVWFYLKGHGYVWRLNCHNMFECGDTYANFDRWALCDIDSLPCPTTKYEFINTVKQLLTAKTTASSAKSDF